MDGPTTPKTLVTIRSSDGISYPIEKQTLLQNTSYFNDIINITPSESSKPIIISLVETTRVVGPLIQFLNPQGLLPTISLFGFENIFAVFQAALKYGFTATVEKTRADIKTEVSENAGVRDLALRLAMESGDQELIHFISELVKEKRSSTNDININGSLSVPANQTQNHDAGRPPRSNVNHSLPLMGNPEKPEQDSSFSPAFDTLFPRTLNPESGSSPASSSITINVSTPALVHLSTSEKNINPESSTPGSLLGLMHQQQQPILPGTGARAIPGVGPMMPMPMAPMELPVSFRFPIEYGTVFALQEFVRLARIERKDAAEIAEREAALERAIERLKTRILALGPEGEREWAEVYQSILEEAEKMEGQSIEPSLPLFPPGVRPVLPVNGDMSALATPTTSVTPLMPATPNTTSALRRSISPVEAAPPPYQEVEAPILERGGRGYSSGIGCSGSACKVFLGFFFSIMLLAGWGTELGLSIVISKGLQSTNLDPSLTVQVTCQNLHAPTTGVCGIPNHWSLAFAYVSPIIAIATVLWTWCCDTNVKYKFTGFAWFVVICTAIASVVGTTQLAIKGYGAADCTTCPGQAVYVPLHKLRDMNRGQAAGAWFVVLGWVLSIVSFLSI